MFGCKMILLISFVMTLTIGQVVPSPLFDIGRRYSELEDIAAKCTRICRANNGVVQIEGDECRCRIKTEDPLESVDQVLKRAEREGLNIIPRTYPRFKRSPCLGVLGMPTKNPSLMQQRLRAYGVGMLAPILGISPEQVNVLVGDIIRGNYKDPIVIGQSSPAMVIGQQIPKSTQLDVVQSPNVDVVQGSVLGEQMIPKSSQLDNVQITNLDVVPGSESSPFVTNGGATSEDRAATNNQYQGMVGSMIETVPSNKMSSDMALEEEPVLGMQRSNVAIVGGYPVPATSVVNSDGLQPVDGPIVSPFKTR